MIHENQNQSLAPDCFSHMTTGESVTGSKSDLFLGTLREGQEDLGVLDQNRACMSLKEPQRPAARPERQRAGRHSPQRDHLGQESPSQRSEDLNEALPPLICSTTSGSTQITQHAEQQQQQQVQVCPLLQGGAYR